VALVVTFIAIAFAIYVVKIEPSRLVVNRTELALPGWPSALAGTKIALLSDLHIGSPCWDLERLRELVTEVNAQHADLILLAGDYTNNGQHGGSSVPIEAIAQELGNLRAPLGVAAVLGNHDWWNGGPRARAAFEANGVRVLDDEVLHIAARGTSFELLGMADAEVRRRSAKEALALVPAGAPTIALVHEPDIFADMDGRALLTLAGHTHGGQVALPLLGRPIVPSRFGQRYAVGHIVEQGRHLFVTTGLGTSILPVRFGVPPEIAVLTLRPER
jgi:predicted MPP superfamily phosphohydrolase